MPKEGFPNHWKGEKGLYCAGFAGRGLLGISEDAENIAKDISTVLNKYWQECTFNIHTWYIVWLSDRPSYYI